MRRVEKIRVREGLTKRALAAKLGTSKDALHNWVSGRAIGRRETVEKLEAFLKSRETSSTSRTASR